MADEQKERKSGEHQDDLAEGERDTVEESIRQHEEKDKEKKQPARSK